jgi:polysaccharide export outer membrane protein
MHHAIFPARAVRQRALAALLILIAALFIPLATRAAEAGRDYVIGSGDVVRISVFQSPDLTLEARVSESGSISYPLLGTVRLGGLSVAQAETEITRGLREGNFLRQPQVSVLVVQVRGNQVSVLGMVNRPGRYPIDVVGVRLSEVMSQAGGVSPGGSDIVSVTGERDGRPYHVEVDLPALYGRQRRGEDPVLRNGDTVFVDRAPLIYIYGEVQRPGAIRLERDMSLMQALAAGGGVTARGTEKGLRVHRRNGDGAVQVIEGSMTDMLQDGDVVYVRESLF